MSDLFKGPDTGGFLSDPDPVKRAQKQMRTPLPRRFYQSVGVERAVEGWAVTLDGKPVRTPGGAVLALPTEGAARLVEGEFSAQRETIDAFSMPVYRLVNTAIDGVAAQPEAVTEDILRFSGSDLLFYRADGPDRLVERQSRTWDPVLDWAREAIGARFFLAEGIVHVEQPRESIGAIAIHLRTRGEPLRLSALHLMTTLMGSALLALAVEAKAIDASSAWKAAHVDEDWNVEHWGEDAEAIARRTARKRDFDAAVALLAALDDSAETERA